MGKTTDHLQAPALEQGVLEERARLNLAQSVAAERHQRCDCSVPDSLLDSRVADDEVGQHLNRTVYARRV